MAIGDMRVSRYTLLFLIVVNKLRMIILSTQYPQAKNNKNHFHVFITLDSNRQIIH